MAKKKAGKRGHKGPKAAYAKLPAEALEAELSRLAQKGDFRAMVDGAKILYKRRPDSATSQWLADAYAGRMGELAAKGLFREAAALIALRNRYRGQELSAAEQQTSVRLLIRSGQWEEACEALGPKGVVPDQADALAADLVLLYPQSQRRLDPQGRLDEGLVAVREALAAYDRGEDDAALQALRPLGLKSAFRYWKLFIRGLVAFYREDREGAAKNFRTIPAELPVADLAAEFPVTGSPDAVPPAGSLLGGTQPRLCLETELAALQAAADRDDLKSCVRGVQRLVGALPEAPALHPVLAAFLWRCLVCTRRRVDDNLWRVTTATLRPFIFDDATFARTLALSLEETGEWDEAIQMWSEFVAEVVLGTVVPPGGGPKEKLLARIHLRVARHTSESLLEEFHQPISFFRRRALPKTEVFEAIDACLEKSLALDPESPGPYLTGVTLARDAWQDVDHAFRWAERLVAAFPEHLEGLLAAADLALRRGVFRKALGLVKKAEAVEPLHPEVKQKRGRCLVLSARKRVEAHKEELAKKDYREALAYHEGRPAAALRLEFGCLHLACDELAEGHAQIEQGLETLGRGAGPLFRLAIEANRLEVPPKLLKDHAAALKTRLTEANTQRALELVGVFREYADTAFPGKNRQRGTVLAYLKRCLRQPFSREDAFTLCQFLADHEQHKLLGALAKRSAKAHPGDFHFPVFKIFATLETDPDALREAAEDTLQACLDHARGAHEERFARFTEEVLARVDPWAGEFVDPPCGCTQPGGAFGMPPSLADLTKLTEEIVGQGLATAEEASVALLKLLMSGDLEFGSVAERRQALEQALGLPPKKSDQRRGAEHEPPSAPRVPQAPPVCQLDLFGDDE